MPLMPDMTEQILDQIRDQGYQVALGTKGYQIHLVATDDLGFEIESVAHDTYEAACDVLQQIKDKQASS